VRLTVDAAANAAYVSVTAAPVPRTERFSESVLVDLAGDGTVVGLELLSLPAAVGVAGRADRYGLDAAVLAERR
jgi:uncharacterized protein YuzE